MSYRKAHNPQPHTTISLLLLGWLIAATTEYLTVFGSLHDLSTIAQMSLLRIALLTLIVAIVLYCTQKWITETVRRWIFPCVILILSSASLVRSFNAAFLVACALAFFVSLCYAIYGWNSMKAPGSFDQKEQKIYPCIVGTLAIAFFIFVSIWTVCRVYTFSAPSYDFGIFSQMFYNMKENGLPLTTLERDGLLSHFKVHMSPIYYSLLPFYCIAPYPATLQVLQAAILASAAIPMWLLCKKHGLHPIVRVLLCLLLFLYPAYSGGTSYDIHENAFLTPLILWLFYAIDSQKPLLIGLFALLVLIVKEDAAVYVAIIGLFVITNSILHKNNQWITGILILAGSLFWFWVVTGYLSKMGDGVMTYRYDNFIYDDSDSLITVIKAVIMCPMKALYESTDSEKIRFILYTMAPLLGMPLFTRRYERYLLLIPYVLVNLMSDYQYQHDVFFQYTFGSTAFLFYLVIVNLADIDSNKLKILVMICAIILSAVYFVQIIVPVAKQYPERYLANQSRYQQTQDILSLVPDDVSVAATTFYTVPLSQRQELYDIRYTSKETILNCKYVVLSTSNQSSYKKYASADATGLDVLINILLENGYTLDGELEGVLQIYRKP